MRSVFVGLCVCICVAFAAPAFGEAQDKGEEKAVEAAAEAVEQQTPAVEAEPPARPDQPAPASEAAAEFGFAEDDIATAEDTAKGIAEIKFTKQTSKTERVKIGLIWNQCRSNRAKKATILGQAATADELRGLVTSGPLASGQSIWNQKHKEVAKLIYTGTEYLCGTIYKDLASGVIGVYSWKQRAGKLDTNLTKVNISKKDAQGFAREEEIEEAPIPTSFSEAKTRTTILSQTITLMTYSLPTVAIIQHVRTDLTDHYEWFWGKDIAESNPPPSLQPSR